MDDFLCQPLPQPQPQPQPPGGSGVLTHDRVVEEAAALAYDTEFSAVREWKAELPGRRAVGYLPIYAPRELIRAAGMLPVGIFGGGDRVEIIRGDACFQSYICHIPRSTVELALTGRLDCLDAAVFPSTCDVIRNLSGMWKILRPDMPVRYLETPHNFDPAVGGKFFRGELAGLLGLLDRLRAADGLPPTTNEALREAIALYDENRRLLRQLAALRKRAPHLAPASDTSALVRAGAVVPVERHNRLIARFLESAPSSGRRDVDSCRIVLRGAFCEQPPPALLRTLERSGCHIVDDDLALGLHWIREEVTPPPGGDPLQALAEAWLRDGAPTACRYAGSASKGEELVRAVHEARAEGVVFAAPSFCDPALLDQPMAAAALDRAGIPWTAFKYAEDTGQFQPIREQAGTFSDSIKLWGER